MKVNKRLIQFCAYKRLPEDEKAIYLGKLFEFTEKYPHDQDAKKLKEELSGILNTVENQLAQSLS